MRSWNTPYRSGRNRRRRRSLGGRAGGPAPAGSVAAATDHTYQLRNLVSDVPGRAQVTDPHLVNAWGALVRDLDTAVGLRRRDRCHHPLRGRCARRDPDHQPARGEHPWRLSHRSGVQPDGLLHRPRADGSSGPALFLFVGESGHLTGWSPAVPPPPPSHDAQDATVTPGAVYKGLAIGQPAGGPLLYAADFSAGTVDVYNGSLPAGHHRRQLRGPEAARALRALQRGRARQQGLRRLRQAGRAA